MKRSELEEMHLAELHLLAAEAGVERYRLLRREQLVEQLANGADRGRETGKRGSAGREGGEDADARSAESPESRRPRRASRESDRESRRRRRDDERGRRSRGDSADSESDTAEETIAGPLEILDSGDGIVHGAGGEKVAVSAAQIRRCQLREGDLVGGPAKLSRRGERGLSLIRIEQVNGAEPVEDRGPLFEDLTAVTPTRPIALEVKADDLLVRAADLVAPLAHGQRVLVRAERRSGRSQLLRAWARAMMAADNPPTVVALLVDERPEEVTEWRRVEQVEVVDAGADRTTDEQLRRATLALAAAKRRAESGQDVVLMIDSLTRLAVAAGEASAVKPFFGAGRDLSEGGSLTVIGVVLKHGEVGDQVELAVETTENTSIDLSAKLADEGIVPAIVDIRPSVGGEELLREGPALAAARRLRSELQLLPPAEAAGRLAERIKGTESNEELLR